jgi:hypothetical protein
MRIHFCDLCNESVPQSDLEEGRAFLRKGRVVCARCDRSMSHAHGDADTGGPFTSEVERAVAETPTPPAGIGSPAPAAPFHAHGPHADAPTAARPSGGFALAFIALLGTVVLGFWIGVRLEELGREIERVSRRLEEGQSDGRARLDLELAAHAERAREAGDRAAAEMRDLREWVGAALTADEERGREAASRLDQLQERIEGLGEPIGLVARHDRELDFLRQRIGDLVEDVKGIGQSLAVLERRGVPAASPDAGPSVGEPAPPPPWMDLVLELSSPNMAERWQAVMALGETRDPAVAEFLLPSLRDADIFVRLVTARVLSELGSALAIPALIDALDDGESAVREAAYAALRTLTQRDLPFDHKEEDKAERARRIKAWRDWWEKEKGRYLEG